MSNPFLERNKKQIGDVGRRAESKTQRRIGGRLTAASGASHEKGDLSLGSFIIEMKSTVARSISLKLPWLLKINHEARAVGKIPALSVLFTDQRGDPRDYNSSWVMIPERDFQRLIGDDK